MMEVYHREEGFSRSFFHLTPEELAEIFKTADEKASYASWAIRFAADLDGVITVLSGMSIPAQMEDNLSYMKDFVHLSETEKNALAQAREALAKIPLIPCTSCNYCAKVCPQHIRIPEELKKTATALS